MKANNQTIQNTKVVANAALKTNMGYKLNQAASSKNPDSSFISNWFSQERHESFKYAKSLVK
ncbi:hypothetical protein H5185_20450 [Shewanella sp. SG44-6]|uniref:hypothetical protein n=1 Tax=Shewanella sp. SG44-6 TaxID=2760959 RepID=UPI00160087D5|nr:hypothetical protein [Shewanella sp. SG44-6]MBB1391760.1 hypothetical protein [Shewanella sp. SG44-6]